MGQRSSRALLRLFKDRVRNLERRLKLPIIASVSFKHDMGKGSCTTTNYHYAYFTAILELQMSAAALLKWN